MRPPQAPLALPSREGGVKQPSRIQPSAGTRDNSFIILKIKPELQKPNIIRRTNKHISGKNL